MASTASNGVLLCLTLGFVIFGAVCWGYMVDYRGWLSKVVDQRVVRAQHEVFNPSRSVRAGLWAGELDRSEVMRRQRQTAGYLVAMCIGVVALFAAALLTRVA